MIIHNRLLCQRLGNLTKGTDDVDKRIMHMLCENPEMSQLDLAKRLKISQPAVSARINNLREKGVLEHLVGIDVRKAQLFLAKIDMVTANTEQVLDFLSKCPLYLNAFLTSGRYNLTILLIGENMRSIVSCVDSHLRPNPIIKEMEFNLVVTPVRDFVVPVKPISNKNKITSCGKDCSSCVFYTNNRCLGCPSSIHYRGNVL